MGGSRVPNAGIVELILVLATIVIFVVVAYAVIVLAARTMHRVMPATTPPRDPAMDALRIRLANGEIDEPEYERLRSTLQRH
jgi:uncharacterized membrane protein